MEISKENQLKSYIAFAGQVSSRMYCLDTAVKAMQDIDGVCLRLYGPERRSGDIKALKQLDKNGVMEYGGVLPFDKVPDILSGALAILVTCSYTKDTNGKMGTLGNNKLFEAMLQGAPVICSDFDLWKDIVDRYRCGICVEPGNEKELRRAIASILDNREEAIAMGQRGREAVKKIYNWESQEKILLGIYSSLEAYDNRTNKQGC